MNLIIELQNNLKQFEEWWKVQLDRVRQLSCVIERREEGALSIAPLLSNCRNVEELRVSVVVRYVFLLTATLSNLFFFEINLI
jgi:hypothetical protein